MSIKLKVKLNLLLILLIMILAGFFIFKQVKNEIKELEKNEYNERQIAFNQSKIKIEHYLEHLQDKISIAAFKHSKKLTQLISNPEKYEDLLTEIQREIQLDLPNSFISTLTDSDGIPLVTDFDNMIEAVCLENLKHFSQTNEFEIRIHPNTTQYHFDIMVSYYNEQNNFNGIFFTSFKTTQISKILLSGENSFNQLLILNTELPGLIEVSSQGDRSLHHKYKLSEKETSRISITQPIKNTSWQLINLPAQYDALKNQKNRIIIKGLIVIITLYIFIAVLINSILKSNKLRLYKAKRKELYLDEKLNNIINSSTDGIISIDEQQTIIFFNPEAEKQFGYSSDEILGKNLSVLLPDDARSDHLAHIYKFRDSKNQRISSKGRGKQLVIKGLHKNGQLFPIDVGISQSKGIDGSNIFTAFIRDITQQKALEQKLLLQTDELAEVNSNLEETIQARTQELQKVNSKLGYQSTHDFLTGLPNRFLGLERLKHAILTAKRHNNKTALFFIDLDRFKIINDSQGHAIGDAILIEVSKRLKRAVRDIDTIVRLGGDEFLIIFLDINHRHALDQLASKIKNLIKEKFIIDEREFYISCSIGIAISPDDSDDAETLLCYADRAMYKAKELGRNHAQYYTQLMDYEVSERFAMETALHSALSNNEFYVVFQPIYNAQDQSISGAEALLRWHSPQFGLVSPDDFIPMMEDNGQIIHIGEWVLQQACTTFALWRKKYNFEGSISVNISTLQLRSREFFTQVKNTLNTSNLPPEKLHLELTERIMIEESNDIENCLIKVHSLGVKFSIDDFGTGYSSLGYLKRFPCDIIKIDKSFVQDIDGDSQNSFLIDAIILIGHGILNEIIAEGVETQIQFDYLKKLNCDFIQGYYFNKPLTAKAFEKLL